MIAGWQRRIEVAPAGYDVLMGQASSLGGNTFSALALLRAARQCDIDRVCFLLGLPGADVNATNQTSLTALHLAARQGHVPVVRELLHRNADVMCVTKRGNTALHIAAMHGHTAVVTLLVASGTPINATCRCGFTPLYLGAMENHTDTVRELLRHGADPSATPQKHCTALNIAELQGNVELAALLRDRVRPAPRTSGGAQRPRKVHTSHVAEKSHRSDVSHGVHSSHPSPSTSASPV